MVVLTDWPHSHGLQIPIIFRLPASEENNKARLDYVSIENQKTIYMPYKGISGVIIPIDTLLYGELEFTLYASKIHNAIFINGFLLKTFPLNMERAPRPKRLPTIQTAIMKMSLTKAILTNWTKSNLKYPVTTTTVRATAK